MNEKRKDYLLNYKRDNYKRIPLDVSKSKFEEIKAAADRVGESMNGFIKTAIDERIEKLGS